MKTSPASVHFRANVEFSLRKPYPGWMPLHPCTMAASMILSPSRYADERPRLTALGELSACCDLASGSVYIVVVLMPD